MIVKKVQASPAKAQSRTKAGNIRDLTDYIAGGQEDEKVVHRGGVNFISQDLAGQQAEMIALASEAVRSPQPVQHWIMSWREGEQPTADQCDRAVALFLEGMGLAEHQVIYAVHADTQNVHLHMAVNRVHPETSKVVTVNKGFEYAPAHRAIARIEHEQGWQRERGGRFQVRDDQVLERVSREAPPMPQPTTKARDMENRTGQKSAQRIAAEEGADLIHAARSWRELHEKLAERGMRFEKKGSGAILWVGDTAVKASAAGRTCSMAALTKRLGPYTAPVATVEPRPRAPEPIAPAAPKWSEYIASRQRHYEGRQKERELLREMYRDDWSSLARRQREERRRTLGGQWRGRGAELNALRSVLAARQAQEKAALKEREQRAREDARKKFRRFPGYEEWLRDHSPELGDEWRHRDRSPSPMIVGDRPDPARPRDIRDFMAQARGWEVAYRRAGAPQGRASFVDHGKRIAVHDLDRDSVLAALQLAGAKWGTFSVHGDESYKRLCVQLAAEHGLRIKNPELQAQIAAERERRLRVPGCAPALPEFQAAGRAPSAPLKQPHPVAPAEPAKDLHEVYCRHFANVAREGPGRGDVSRLDGIVAVRMRLTGHGQADVERAIREGAPKVRNEERDWNAYAKRAAAFAFDLAGSRQAALMMNQRKQLLSLEGQGTKVAGATARNRGDPRL